MTTFEKIKELLDAYKQPHRKYHTVEHVNAMTDLAEESLGWVLSEAQIWAIAYHDSVYNIPVKNNERLSADLYLSHFGNTHPFAKTVETIICDTEKHIPSIDESRAVIDLDLSCLVFNYEDYRKKIRDEFIPFCGEEAYLTGRRLFLVKTLAKDRIFWYEAGGKTKEWEAIARTNMKNELDFICEQQHFLFR